MRYLRGFLVFLTVTALGCGSGKPSLRLPDGPPTRVLFLGNSLTTMHDVPALVQAMAAAGGVRLEYQTYAPGNYSLEDHWNDGEGRRLLAASKWDYLVLQQGPSTQADSQANLRDWAVRWAAEARTHGVKPALYAVWPWHNQKDGFTLNDQAYRTAAAAADALPIPTGLAWRDCTTQSPDISLYLPDGLHARLEGAWLAALVITQRLTNVKPESVPARLVVLEGRVVELPRDRARRLCEAAGKVGD